MVEFDRASLRFAESKLTNLLHQIDFILEDDFSNDDILRATHTVRTNIQKLLSIIRNADGYSDHLKEQVLLRCSQQLFDNSYLLGIIFRSNATRNPFELYFPFRQIAENLINNSEVNLILSSEWNYVPFTYPMTLQELPNFIIIGMPAPEADNVLAFPAAGHELGHSIWQNHEIREKFSDSAYRSIVRSINSNREFLTELFPQFTVDQFESDLFASRLQDITISDVLNSTLRQLEELFCDLIAVEIFGVGYLHAFRYLLAPSSSEERYKHYPDIKERARIISQYAELRGFEPIELERWFSDQDTISQPFDTAITELADKVRTEFHEQLFTVVSDIASAAQIQKPSTGKTAKAKQSFEMSMPVEQGVSLGDLICAAWEIFLDRAGSDGVRSADLGASVSNLVLKSAESIEFKARMQHVGQI